MPAVKLDSFATFGALLHFLRRRARLTQRDLAIATGYSEAHISRLENNQRLPDLTSVVALIVPALDLNDDASSVGRLLELAAAARGEVLVGANVTLSKKIEQQQSELGLLELPPPLPLCLIERKATSQLQQRLASERYLMVNGLAGVGKTVIASQLAQRWGEHCFWFSFTATINLTSEILLRQLALFLLSHGADQVEPLLYLPNDGEVGLSFERQLALLIHGLQHIPALLCFDNAQLLIDQPQLRLILEQLAQKTSSHIVVLSREQFNLQGFSYWVLHGFEPSEAQALLAHYGVEAGQHVIERTQANPALLRLTIGLLTDRGAAAAGLLHLIDEPQIASFVLEQLLRQLPSSSERLLTLLAVAAQQLNLHAEWPMECSFAVDGPYQWQQALSDLTRRQLIDTPSHATVLPLVQDYLYAQLRSQPARRKGLHRQLAIALHQLDPMRAAQHFIAAADLPAALDCLYQQRDHLIDRGLASAAALMLQTMRPTLEQQHPTYVLQWLQTYGEFLMATSQASAAEAIYREALAVAWQPTQRADLVWRLVGAMLHLNQAAAAQSLLEQTIASLDREEIRLHGLLQMALSKALLMQSQFDPAREAAAQAIALANQLDSSQLMTIAEIRARAGGTVAIVQQYTGEIEASIQTWQAVLAQTKLGRLERVRPRALANLANLYYTKGDLNQAEATIDQAVAGLRQIGDLYAQARMQHTQAIMQLMRGQPQQALATLEQTCVLKQQIADQQGWFNSRNQMAITLIALGQTEQAQHMSSQNLQLLGAAGEPLFRGAILDTAVLCQLLAGDFAAARQGLEQLAALANAQHTSGLHMAWQRHTLLLSLLAEGADQARNLLSQSLPPAGNGEAALDYACLAALISHAIGDQATAQREWQQLAQRAAITGYEYYRIVAAAQLHAPSNASVQQRVLQLHQPFAAGCWEYPALAQAVNCTGT
ncbi:helix-turn-helix domain-containing protein [Herpetosiphon llansteffanensis]